MLQHSIAAADKVAQARCRHTGGFDARVRPVVWFLHATAWLGMGAIVLHHAIRGTMSLAGASLLAALAFFVLGLVAGFLFSLPRPAKSEDDKGSGLLTANQNLLEVSDWITKSVVALSIANISDLPKMLRSAGAYVAGSDAHAADQSLIASIAVVYFSIGLLLGYILTRGYLTEYFHAVDQSIATDADWALRQATDGVSQVQFALSAAQGDEPARNGAQLSEAEWESAARLRELASSANAGELRRKLRELGAEYELIRQTMAKGYARTSRLETVVAKMRALSLAALKSGGPSLMQDLTASPAAGDRLAAIVMLEMSPDSQWLNWLADRLATEPPFAGYHAALALERAVDQLSDAAVRPSLERAIEGLGERPETDRHSVLTRALARTRRS